MDDPVSLVPVRIQRAQILTDRTAVVESHAASDGQPVANGHGVSRKHRRSQQHTTNVGRKVETRCSGARPELEPDSSESVDRMVLAAFELSPILPWC